MIGTLTKIMNDISRTPYKIGIFVNKGMRYTTKYCAINERFDLPFGSYNDKTPYLIDGHKYYFMWDIENALNYIVKKEAEKEKQDKEDLEKIKGIIPKFSAEMKELRKFLIDAHGITIDLKESDQNFDSLTLEIEKISPVELKATREMTSYTKAVAAKKKEPMKLPDIGSMLPYIALLILAVFATKYMGWW